MTAAVTVAQSGAPGVSLGFKNRIINGGMTIDQRNAGASVTATSGEPYTVDRWACYSNPNSKFTVQQNAGSVTPPAGFVNYLGITSSSSYAASSSDWFSIEQAIEGYNVADLAWGTQNAKTVTLSFQVRSSIAGTFSGSLRNGAANRVYPFTYTISSTSTWTSISVTVPGDTTGTWATGNTAGLWVFFDMGSGTACRGTAGAWTAGNYCGATGAGSIVGTSGATFYITGVQLEVGTAATQFEFRDYGRELMMCQRYYEKSYLPQNAPGTNGANGYIALYTGSNTVSGSQVYGTVFYKQQKRAAPTVTSYGYGGTATTVSSYVGTDQASATGSLDANSYNSFVIFNGAGSWTTQNYWIIFHFTASAEL